MRALANRRRAAGAWWERAVGPWWGKALWDLVEVQDKAGAGQDHNGALLLAAQEKGSRQSSLRLVVAGRFQARFVDRLLVAADGNRWEPV